MIIRTQRTALFAFVLAVFLGGPGLVAVAQSEPLPMLRILTPQRYGEQRQTTIGLPSFRRRETINFRRPFECRRGVLPIASPLSCSGNDRVCRCGRVTALDNAKKTRASDKASKSSYAGTGIFG